ncbi:GCN5-like N-acetyltransferase [Caballeronia sordidicola]|uniref:GCN5-like N-acetyltransferase n=1 Tax=Caballeronia sordidicola TaxID=196367 RepID=A0A158GH94_CABSO|nr:GNAT family N-acetyltransferase [Caballeronia sordidicola]SAL31392.1 GCN5-like N-acetyltransferase [Caballeronia sordidicola]
MTNLYSEFDWRWASFNELDAFDVYTVLAARSEVFVIEQQCLYADIDGQDTDAWHLLVLGQTTHAELAGYLRVLPPDETGDVRIGRVLTRAPFRGIGLGQAMLERTLEHIAQQWPGRAIRLHAQAHLQRFYASSGFEPISDVHLEDDIPHIWMRREAGPR